jgi:hypothetical protein
MPKDKQQTAPAEVAKKVPRQVGKPKKAPVADPALAPIQEPAGSSVPHKKNDTDAGKVTKVRFCANPDNRSRSQR